MPATLARISNFPTVCAARAQSASLAISSNTNCPPMRLATACPLASSRSAIQTVAPAWAKVSAIAAPIPEAPPVTSAVFLCRLNTIDPFCVSSEELNLLLLFREWQECLDHLHPPLVTRCHGHDRPVAPEYQSFRAEARKSL